MSDALDLEYTSIERHVLLAWWLCSGDKLTVGQVAQRFRMKSTDAGKMFNRISRKLPIYCDELGNWRKVEETCG